MAEKIVFDSKKVQLLLLYKFRKHSNVGDATKNICDAMGALTVSYDTTKVWSRNFKNGDCDFGAKRRSGRPTEVDDEHLLELVEEDPHRGTRELAEEPQCHHDTIAAHLNHFGKTWKFGVWITHDLSRHQLQVGGMHASTF
ncbi:hypothetical protein Aduo_007909 [Ancylostoma duodenale]